MTSEESNEAKTEGKLPGLAMNTLFLLSRPKIVTFSEPRGRTPGIFSRSHKVKTVVTLWSCPDYQLDQFGDIRGETDQQS